MINCKNSETNREKESEQKSKSNLVIIYADDLGYGDLSSYGATELQTPYMDKLVNEGVRFANGYTSSATCSPSRFVLLTGMYPWHIENVNILPGTAHLLIDTVQITLPKMLKMKWHQGYNNSIVNGIPRIGFMKGAQSAKWVDEEMAHNFLSKA